jgi:hypothetical protein
MKNFPAYVSDTDGSKSLDLKMPGLAILLFAANKTCVASDNKDEKTNAGTILFKERVKQSI